MIEKGIILFILILFSGIFTLVALILAIVKLSGSRGGGIKWLIGFFIGLAALFTSIFIFTRAVVNKTQEFAQNLTKVATDQMGMLDSLNMGYQFNEDSVLNSAQVNKLMQMEPEADRANIPSRFYTYLGFRDYYRLPLKYPFSLHCMDSLGNAELFDERNVVQFDVNNNGEVSTNVQNIQLFAFNDAAIIGARNSMDNGKIKTSHFYYDLANRKLIEFTSKKDLMKIATTKGFKEDVRFYSCKEYFEGF